ncbi:MAG: replicative DNA helicase [Clostridiales bacterium]|nr:replicative DNA helicase [Clostridiales bacterium]
MEQQDLLHITPPNSVDAERSVLGAALQDSGAATLAIETLQADDFYSPEHQEIFSAVKTLYLNSGSIDVMTVSNELSTRGTLDGVGGSPYLLSACRYVPTTANTASYIRIVQEKSTLRKLITACRRIEEECYTQMDDMETLLSNAERLIFDIVMRRGGTDTLTPIGAVLMETFDKLEKLSRLKGKLSGVPTGLYELDRKLTCLHGGELIIAGARPGMGKTALALGVTLFAAERVNSRIAVFTMEMPREQIGMRILSNAANINMQRLRSGMLSDDEWMKVGDCLNRLSACRIFIDDTAGLTPSRLRSRVRRLMMEQNGLDLIVVDYLGLMSSDRRHDNRQQEVSEISRRLKAIALELKVPILACAQLARGNTARRNKRPQLSDLRDSGSIEQDADVVVFIHREKYYQADDPDEEPAMDDGAAELIVSKQRNGPVGTVEVEWQEEFARFINPPGIRVPSYTNENGD